ncbi:MAG: poly-beta-1,6-N-acetyl-D-glucosamine biosynthesis protein PgaD [Candidatus Saccharibacteria bacterium]|nr:poly-beta-1,6-N-acetyl-D-glucosamine biosynthesis protein PgaD [Moraxellaceae bacterium]
MNNPLIINIRKQMDWQQRLFSDSSTALMWAMWLYLWRPMVVITGVHAVNTHPVLFHFVTKISPAMMSSIIAVVIFGAVGLLLWARLPSNRIRPMAHKTLTDYARHFQLSKQDIIAAREAQICTVDHDRHGRIIGVRPQE